MKWGYFAILAVAVVVASAVVVAVSDRSDAADDRGVYVYIDGSPVEVRGSTSLKDAVQRAFDQKGIGVILSGTGVAAVDGQAAPSGKSWTIQQWLPPRGWKVVNFINAPGNFVKGTSYAVHLADQIPDGGSVTYSAPSFEPRGTAWFYIKFLEDIDANPHVRRIPTEDQRSGFWVKGDGSMAAWAFKDACATNGFELNMSDGVRGDIVDPDYIGWLFSFLGLEDVNVGKDAWKYWSQFYWDGSKWIYGETLGHYDPNVTGYFALLRQITLGSGEEPEPTKYTRPDVTPADATLTPSRYVVTFVDGDGRTIRSETVRSGASATPPETAAKSPENGVTFTFKGWEGGYTNVRSDVTIHPIFKASAGMKPTGVKIVSSATKMSVGDSYIFLAETLPMEIEDSKFEWSSDDPGVLYFKGGGVAVAKGEGNANVTVSAGGYTASVAVSVELTNEAKASNTYTSAEEIKGLIEDGFIDSTGTLGITVPSSALITANTVNIEMKRLSVIRDLNDAERAVAGSNKVYSIEVKVDNVLFDQWSSRPFKITLPYDGEFGSDVAVFYLDQSKVERFPCTWDREGGKVTFETHHLSKYFIGESADGGGEGGGGSGDGTAVYIAVAVMAVAAVAIGLMLVRRAHSEDERLDGSDKD